MLALDAVTYRYAGARRAALREVSLELRDGEVLGIVGASEAGKTTLALVASGLAPRAIGGTLRGRLLLDGDDVAALPMHEVAAQVGIGFQNPATQLSGVTESVFEEVAFGPMNLGVPRDDVIARTWDALTALRVETLAERDPARLSGGQQQLVAIAGLLALRPRHLVLDEPTAQLDPAGTRLVAEALARLAADGASICVVEQKTDLLAGLANRIAVIDAGRIAFEGPAAEVLADPRIADLGITPPAPVRLARAAAAAALPAEPAARLADAIQGVIA
ncbi:MAG TPA: ABC transporter ATP-binding protein [Candidatus Limnocylindria bacterium]|nr:ABC transporter ATP-binding protein [Candidatus Limnocylindria bacterium]